MSKTSLLGHGWYFSLLSIQIWHFIFHFFFISFHFLFIFYIFHDIWEKNKAFPGCSAGNEEQRRRAPALWTMWLTQKYYRYITSKRKTECTSVTICKFSHSLTHVSVWLKDWKKWCLKIHCYHISMKFILKLKPQQFQSIFRLGLRSGKAVISGGKTDTKWSQAQMKI